MGGGCDFKSELQLSADMFCWQPSAQRVVDHPITVEGGGGETRMGSQLAERLGDRAINQKVASSIPGRDK